MIDQDKNAAEAAAQLLTATLDPERVGALLTVVALAASCQLVLKEGMANAQYTSRESGRSLLLVAASSPWIISGLTTQRARA